jgi:hypothetical protein
LISGGAALQRCGKDFALSPASAAEKRQFSNRTTVSPSAAILADSAVNPARLPATMIAMGQKRGKNAGIPHFANSLSR